MAGADVDGVPLVSGSIVDSTGSSTVSLTDMTAPPGLGLVATTPQAASRASRGGAGGVGGGLGREAGGQVDSHNTLTVQTVRV